MGFWMMLCIERHIDELHCPVEQMYFFLINPIWVIFNLCASTKIYGKPRRDVLVSAREICLKYTSRGEAR